MKDFKTLPPLKSLGQNFLRHPDTARRILEALPIESGDAVVELGAGQGALTFLLGAKAGTVLALEIDAGLAALLAEKVREAGQENIRVSHADMLKADWGQWLEVLKGPFWIVGNLPYQLSTAVLFRIIEFRSILKGAYVMLQKEVADRLLGRPGQKAYGLLTVLIGYYAEVQPLLQLGPGSFFPRPKVSSTFLELRLRKTLEPENPGRDPVSVDGAGGLRTAPEAVEKRPHRRRPVPSGRHSGSPGPRPGRPLSPGRDAVHNAIRAFGQWLG